MRTKLFVNDEDEADLAAVSFRGIMITNMVPMSDFKIFEISGLCLKSSRMIYYALHPCLLITSQKFVHGKLAGLIFYLGFKLRNYLRSGPANN